MEEAEILKSLGFDAQEAEIYIYLIRMGASTQQEISDNLQIIRQTVYDLVKKMLIKGNVSLSKDGKKKLYSAVDPEILLNRLKEKQEKLEKIMPSLKKQKNFGEVYSESFIGLTGLRNLFSLSLIENKPVFWAANLEESDIAFKDFYWDNYAVKRIEKKIPLKLLLEKSKDEVRYGTDKKVYREVRSHPILKNTRTSFFTFGDNSVLYNTSENIPFGVLIRNKEIKEFLEKVFLELWEQASPVR